MALKSEIVKDVLCVIAYGTTSAKTSATKLLFYYWPLFNTNLFDLRSVLAKFSSKRNDVCTIGKFIIKQLSFHSILLFNSIL